jgi:hypothetical protein
MSSFKKTDGFASDGSPHEYANADAAVPPPPQNVLIVADSTYTINAATKRQLLNETVLKNGGCGRASRKVNPLLHSATGRQLILPLNDRSDVTLQGVSRAVQPDQRAALRITRDTCYADSSGI